MAGVEPIVPDSPMPFAPRGLRGLSVCVFDTSKLHSSAAELPSFETSNTQTDSPRNPLGAKGIGESGTIGSTPAIQNAVVDAVSHLGVKHIDMPCTAERVWQAIQAAKQPANA